MFHMTLSTKRTKKKKTSLQSNQLSAESEMKPQFSDQECDSVLPGQRYHKPEEVLTDRHGVVISR